MKDRRSTALARRELASSGSYQTALSPIECQERLLEVLEGENSGAYIYGTVTPEGFELHRGTRVRAGAHPVLRGSFTPDNSGTRVDYRTGSSKSRQPLFRIAAAVWAVMALSWVIFFLYWIVDRDGIGIGLPRLLLLLGIVVLMGGTIAAGRRSDDQGGADLLEILHHALPPANLLTDDDAPDGIQRRPADAALDNREDVR